MGSDIDTFDDILPEPAVTHARAGGRFQPKAKAQPRRETSASVPSTLPDGIKHKLVTPASNGLEAEQSLQPIVANSVLQDSAVSSFPASEVTGTEEPLKGSEVSFSEDVGLLDALHSDNVISDGNCDSHSNFGKSAREDDTLGFYITSFDDILPEPVTEDHTYPDYCMTQDSITRGETAVSNNDFQIGNRRLETEFQEGGAFPGLETLDIMSEATIASGRRTSKFLPKHKIKEKSGDPRPNAVESTMCFPDAQLAASETEYTNEGSIPAFPPEKFLNKASVGFSDSIPLDHTSELRVNEETRNAAQTSPSNATISDIVHPEAVAGTSGEVGAKSRKRKTNNESDLSLKEKNSSAALEENEGGKSSRQQRKRVDAHQLVDEPVDEANDAFGISAEAPGASGLDEDEHDDEYTLQGSSHQKKRAPRKSKKPVTENEKSARKRKKASEALDNSTKEAPKKFSHSTRRTKRCVNKVLLNTPEDEIDYRKLPIKDLILFAGFKERMAIKEAKTSKIPLTNQSAANSFPGEASHCEDENLDSAQDRDSADDQAAPMSQLEHSYFNYQSYMDKTPITRWSKQDTELFYEAVQQFGTDFSMIQQLFPGRTRHQVKLKFKKEERQHPLRLAEAVKNRAKVHSHFESVIERLKQAATQEEQDNAEDSIDMTGKEGEEVTQIDEEAAQPKQEREKSERDEEVAGEDLEGKVEEDVGAGAPADVSHLKSDESEEDEANMWSQYKSEY